jgi:hypothetical protein
VEGRFPAHALGSGSRSLPGKTVIGMKYPSSVKKGVINNQVVFKGKDQIM